MDEVDYDTVNAQLKSLAESLRGADEATVEKGTPAERIAHAERVKREIGELSRQAPVRESMTILRLNSTLVRLIERLRHQTSDS